MSNLQSGWRPEEVRNPFSTRNPASPQVSTTITSVTATSLERSQIQATNVTIPQQSTFSQRLPAQMHHPSLAQANLHKQRTPAIPQSHQSHSINPRLGLSSAVNSQQYINSVQSLSSSIGGPQLQAQTISSSNARTMLAQAQQQTHVANTPQYASGYTNRSQMGNLGHLSDSWSASQAPVYKQANQNNYNPPPSSSSYGGASVQQPHLRSGPLPNGFESWSPGSRSPTRANEYMSRRNLPEPSINNGNNYRVDRSREWNSSGYREFQDPNKLPTRRWHDRRH